MVQRLISLWIVVYVIYFLSTLFHELNHKRKAKKYGLTILKSKQEVVNADQKKELSKISFFMCGFQFKIFGASVHIKDGEIEKLSFNQQKEVLMAGIKSDLLFSIIFISIYFLVMNFQLFNIVNILSNGINYIFSFSLLIIMGKTFDNIFDPFNKGGDIRKLFMLKNKVAET